LIKADLLSRRCFSMIIDLQTITEEKHVHEVLDRDWWQMPDPSHQVLGFGSPLQVDVNVSKTADKVLLDGTLSGGVKVRCDRCLEPFDLDLKSNFNVYLVARPSGTSEEEVELLDDDMEVDFIKGDKINLDDIVREQIYLSVPMKCVCRSDCQGLCPQCGANLNKAPCSCSSRTGHPAFSKLERLNS
jgi:uncharacterized protein